MRVTVELSDADVEILGPRPFGVATAVHALVRREARRLGGPGRTAVEYEDDDRTMREEADPPGLLRGPFAVEGDAALLRQAAEAIQFQVNNSGEWPMGEAVLTALHKRLGVEEVCESCHEVIYEDGDENWCHASDGALTCERLSPDSADGGTLARPARSRW